MMSKEILKIYSNRGIAFYQSIIDDDYMEILWRDYFEGL
jgi:hypothetical protein